MPILSRGHLGQEKGEGNVSLRSNRPDVRMFKENSPMSLKGPGKKQDPSENGNCSMWGKILSESPKD